MYAWLAAGLHGYACTAYQKVSAAEGDTPIGVPFLAVQEVACVAQEPLFDAWVEDDGTEGALGTRGRIPPETATGQTRRSASFHPQIGINTYVSAVHIEMAFFSASTYACRASSSNDSRMWRLKERMLQYELEVSELGHGSKRRYHLSFNVSFVFQRPLSISARRTVM